jgi:hypothetical protein
MRIALGSLFALFCMVTLQAQKSGLRSITIQDLHTHMAFLASDELEGRNTGEPGLEVAARYLAVQACRIGLEPAGSGKDYFQYYTILERSCDQEHSGITILKGDSALACLKDPFYVIPDIEEDTMLIEGEVVFAGYGISDPEYGYNDFDGLDVQDKVVMIMTRGPLNEEGTEVLFDNYKWNDFMSLRYKLPYIYAMGAKAVLVVQDPKSGYRSLDDAMPGMAEYLSRPMKLKTGTEAVRFRNEAIHAVMIHRGVADQLLEACGHSLEVLQEQIDSSLQPRSFNLGNLNIRIVLHLEEDSIPVRNVFGLIEGNDPELKDEVVLYLAHYDHLGTDGKGGIFNGADDNASGTVALIEIAEAFMKKRPARSIGFLWVSAEEIGLFGSEYFAAHPLVETGRIAAVINLDMIGRSRTVEDDLSERKNLTIAGGDTIKVIGGLQSSVLMEINRKTLKEMGMTGNYRYNDPGHPERYFYRSDHINFARRNIPVLFYSTGTHRDYHTLNDVEERIDYKKYHEVTRFCYRVGYHVASYRGPILVDHPMSGW